jgi:phosphoribosyl 1,2-cyclic phosphodiesterase
VKVHLCGVRGSTPAPGADFLRYGGHTSCLAVAHEDADAPCLILDAGTGIRSVSALMAGRPFIGTILLTHLHWDHVQGLPFFSAGDHDDAEVSLFLPEQPDGSEADAVLSRAMSPPHFPMGPGGLRGDWSFGSLQPGETHHQGFDVLAAEIPHKGGRTFGYRVSDPKTHGSIAYLPDHCPTELGPGPAGLGELHPAALQIAGDVDVLVHDAQLLNTDELAAEGRFGHAAAAYAVELGQRAKVKTVVLFHHRPDRTDAALEALAGSWAAAAPQVLVATQGQVLRL